MELRPREPERLMTAGIGAIRPNGADTTGVEFKADIFERNLVSLAERN